MSRRSSLLLVARGLLVLTLSWAVLPVSGAARSRGTSARDGQTVGKAGNAPAKGTADSKDKRKRTRKEDVEEPEEQLFLKEGAGQEKFLPDVYRCPECGYEQDESGACPDHDQFALVKVLSQGKNPLAPTEVDGNEDLIVDIPLTGLTLRTVSSTEVATASEALDKSGSGKKFPKTPSPGKNNPQ